MSDVKCRTKYAIASNDVSHLNTDGMNMVEPIFEKWIAEQYMTLNNIEASPADTDPAPEETTLPVTEAPETEPAKKGCGSALTALLPVALITLAGACTVRRKRR